MKKSIANFIANESGATAIEYVVLAVFIGTAIITAAWYLGATLSSKLSAINTRISGFVVG